VFNIHLNWIDQLLGKILLEIQEQVVDASIKPIAEDV
jgi:hypothetical protein